MTETQPITKLETVLSEKQLSTLVKASKAWKTFDRNAKILRSKLYLIGDGLNIIYTDLKDKGVKRDEIARLVKEYFPDMTEPHFRSDIRYLADKQFTVEKWAKKHYPKGYNAANLCKRHREYAKHLNVIYNRFAPAPWIRSDGHGNVFNLAYDTEEDVFFFPEVDISRTGVRTKVTDKKIIKEQRLKTGLEVGGAKVTVKDTRKLAEYFFNNLENLYNADKYSADDDTAEILVYIHGRAKDFVELTYQTVKMETSKLKKAA